jgi:hypothetical protein
MWISLFPGALTTSPPEKRITIDVDPDYLFGLADDKTRAQAVKLQEPFIGKWMKLSGPIVDVSNVNGRSFIVLRLVILD